ncbi:MAG: hypothetical protein K2N79_01520 [Muribaculaceae bacterium]|nr:hypothetical protein [Muribaculaceae bacterium]MDE7368937.1 hypothetical protein [Muribaculaceae bacterium]
MNNPIATDIHRISPSHFVMVMARFKASVIIGGLFAVLLVSLVAGYLFNTIFYIIGPAIILVLGPVVLSLIYFYYALSPEAAMMTRPHRVIFSNDKIDIDYYRHVDEKEDDTESHLTSSSYKTQNIDAHIVSPDILIKSNSGRSNIVAVVPFDSFTSSQNLNSAIQMLNIASTYNPQL